MDNKKGAIYELILIMGLILITTIFASIVEVIDESTNTFLKPVVISAFNG